MTKYIIIGIIVLLLIYIYILYNGIVRINNKVKEAFSTMDVYLKKRWDLIPSLVETVKGYTKHEKDTFKEVIELRNKSYDTMSTEEKLKSNELVTKNIPSIMALSESYPELKSNENFIELSKSLSLIEDEIAQSRKYYNACVRMFNNKIEVFPNSIFAKMLKYEPKKMFEASSEEKANVKVDL